jgi:acetyl-CoA synthetase
MLPELPIAMLACARIGAVHSVVFSGFSAQALIDRINDAQSKIIITADGGVRKGKLVELKKVVDESLPFVPSVEHIIVLKRAGNEARMGSKDLWWHELMEGAKTYCLPEQVESTEWHGRKCLSRNRGLRVCSTVTLEIVQPFPAVKS